MSRPFDATLPPRPDGEGSAARVRLICVEGGGPSASLEGGELRLGRSTDNDLVLPDDRVSRRHARMVPRDGDYFVEDLGSSNGSRVNGRPLQAGRPQLLRHLDEVKMGDLLYLFLDLGRGSETGLAVELDEAAVDAEVDRLLAEFRVGRSLTPAAGDASGDAEGGDENGDSESGDGADGPGDSEPFDPPDTEQIRRPDV